MLPEETRINFHDFDPLVQRMLKESGERWLATLDRSQLENEILICVEPPRAFALRYENYEGMDRWTCSTGVMSGTECAEFYGTFGTSYAFWLGSLLNGQYAVRAFIKNGRIDEWTFSVEIASKERK